jgi:hypothetical protein
MRRLSTHSVLGGGGAAPAAASAGGVSAAEAEALAGAEPLAGLRALPGKGIGDAIAAAGRGAKGTDWIVSLCPFSSSFQKPACCNVNSGDGKEKGDESAGEHS